MIGNPLELESVWRGVEEEVSQGLDIAVDSVEDGKQVGVAIIEQRIVVLLQVGHIYQTKTPLGLKRSPFVLFVNKNTLHTHVSN